MQNKKYYGDQTEHAIENFGSGALPASLIIAYAEVKKACIQAIQDYEKFYEPDIYESIIAAIDKIIAGNHHDQFPLSLKQGGAGTSINFCLNEVIASLAEEIYFQKYSRNISVHPIDHINRHQSTNDTFPTAVTILFLKEIVEIEKKVIRLQEILIQKENEYQDLVITGRTEMQNALPITLGQVFASWAGCIERDRWRLNKVKERVRNIALGGTAIGTCFFAPREYVFLAETHLRNITTLPLARSQNLTDEIGNQDKLTEVSNALSLCADNLFKITGDLLLYTSGFIGELKHPELQFGSTIMAAKTNPVILEFVRGLSIHISGEAAKIRSYASNGQLQLNAYLPFILDSFLEASHSLKKSINSFIYLFLEKFTVNYKRIEENLISSHVFLNTLLPVLNYDKIKEIYHKIENIKPKNMDEYKQILQENTHLSIEKINYYLNPINCTTFLKEEAENES